MISRLLKSKLLSSPKSALLLGPRQVGKSTLIEQLEPDLTINLNDDKTFLDFKSNPNQLKELLQAKKPRTVFVDEIQRHPSLLNTIQTIVDSKEGKTIKFFITGSSARKLKRGEANLLPGRIFSFQLGPLCAAELDYALDTDRALRYGCLPEPYLSASDELAEKLLTTYSGVYLKEEIQAEALTRNLDGFSRFVLAAAATSGSILDFSKLAKQAKIERKLCSRFYEILEDTLIASRIHVFDETWAEIQRRPKFYFFDTGVLNGLLENFACSADRKGALFEHLVVNQILASAKARDISVKLHYFRTRGGYEVDLILSLAGKLFAIEIKSGQAGTTEARHLLKMREYCKKIAECWIVTAEHQDRMIEGVRICDLPLFLKRIGLSSVHRKITSS